MTPFEIIDTVKVLLKMSTAFPGMIKRQYQAQDKIQAYQLNHLRHRLNDANNHVKLYQSSKLPHPNEILCLTDWEQIPVLTKAEILAHATSDRLNNKFNINNLIESKSSGSSGQALTVYYDKPSFYIFTLASLRMYCMMFAYMPWHKQTYIYTSSYPSDSFLGTYRMSHIPTLLPIPQTLEKLRNNPPDFLTCYPSHLRMLVDQMTEKDFSIIKPKAICVNSEMSSARERKYLSEKLKSPVFDEYSSEELLMIASQCKSLNYHITDDINYIEILDDQNNPLPDGRVGNIIGTNLHNQAMPLLRYAQGDRGSISTKTCPCGRKFRLLEKLEGRKNDAFVLPDGTLLSPGFLLDLTYEIFLKFDQAVRSFCLIQEQPYLWILELVPGTLWHSQAKDDILAHFIRHLNQPEVKIEIKLVAETSRTASGKNNPIQSRIQK